MVRNTRRLATMDQEQRRSFTLLEGSAERVHAGHRRAIDLLDDVALAQARGRGLAVGADRGHEHATVGRQVEFARLLGRQRLHAHPEAGGVRCRVVRARTGGVVASLLQFTDGDRHRLRLATTHDIERQLRARRDLRDAIAQFVVVLDLARH